MLHADGHRRPSPADRGRSSPNSIADAKSAGLRGDIGGFGVSDADLQWSVTGGFDYRPWERTSIKFGWRYYSIDMETTLSDGAFAYDVSQHGPYVAMTFRFQ